MLGARRIAAARVFGTLITATRDGPRKLPSPLGSGAQNDRSSPGTDSFTRKLPHWRGMVPRRGRGERTLWDGLVKETAKYSVFAGCSWLLSDHRLVAKAEVFRGKRRQPDCSWPGLSAKTASSTRRGGSHLSPAVMFSFAWIAVARPSRPRFARHLRMRKIF